MASGPLPVDRLREQPVVASAQLAVERSGERSIVTRARSAAPLRLLAPASPGRAAWVYQSSLGGGFVGRDAIELAVDVAEGAAGRGAHGECWAFGRLALCTEIGIDGAPVLREAVVVAPAHGELALRM